MIVYVQYNIEFVAYRFQQIQAGVGDSIILAVNTQGQLMLKQLFEKALKEINDILIDLDYIPVLIIDENKSTQEAPHLRTEFIWKKLQPQLDGYYEQIAEQKQIATQISLLIKQIEIYKQDISQQEQLSKNFLKKISNKQLEKKM
ncbi:unnamed protein product (macronuclear) [Paramecium tetraurelia]|uniref:Uncharacterized protein n=1 Tax=Paramecium tetraurelia TaxID=5888 RepID=A0DDL3_PARTE|nr:uncharacterized protein GSPATT00039437001 [Paramecium tetraurelia]CAK81130.1 unnamed protein product [Paramecium tetraurelia]|eukprot:XP_001448527.1 hypothetical protein (macronuclear) [Paramecium tetraurelia strain d4-2]